MAAKKSAGKTPAKPPPKAVASAPAKKDPIQVAIIEVRKDFYDEVPRDWPRQHLESVKEVVIRPLAERQRTLVRPVSVEILAPASVIRKLRKEIGKQFAVIVTSTG